MSDTPLFSCALKDLLNRPKSDRSQRWLCSVTRLSRPTVNRLINGTQEPAEEHLRAICAAFPDWHERRQIIVGHLADRAKASGDGRRIRISTTDGEGSEIPHISPEFDGNLRIIANRMLDELHLPQEKRKFTTMIDLLSDVIVETEALKADYANAQDAVSDIDAIESNFSALEANAKAPADSNS